MNIVSKQWLKARADDIRKVDFIDPALYRKYNVKRGLRNEDGTGVLVGLTTIGNVHGYVVFATGFLPVSAQNDATNRPPVQTYYLPIPEEDLLQTLISIHGGASWTLPAEPIESYNSIVVFVDSFEDYITGEGDNLGFGYFHMRATPPYNTAEIELNDANAHFFKIRVDNLADEVR